MVKAMISQTAEYALRAMVFLAMNAEAATREQIAETTKVPPGYLSKILQKLVKEGYVVSQRGLRGGYALASTPAEVSILDIINAVDPIERLLTCPLGIESHGHILCPLHKSISEATASVETAFSKITLKQLLVEAEIALCSSSPFTPTQQHIQ